MLFAVCITRESTNKIPFAPTLSIQDSIYKKDTLTINAHPFTINYRKNAPKNSINPKFPAIHITTSIPHSGWIHVVHTDAYDIHTKKYNLTFIDAGPDLFPLYSKETDFYDAPLWAFSLWSRPLTYWHGHAYPIQYNQHKKTIHLKDGISWGFTLPLFGLSPNALSPRLLTEDEKNTDLKFIKMNMSGYKFQK